MENKLNLKYAFMRRSAFQIFRHALVSISIGLLVSGCGRSVPPNFYTLTPKNTPLVSSNVKLIQVMPVTLPERLNSQLMVLQKSDGKTYVLDSQRWASTLSDELQSALSAGLQQKLGANDVYNSGLTDGKVSYLIAPEFSRFDIVEDHQSTKTNIEVMASWIVKRKDPIQIAEKKSKQPLSYQQFNCRLNFNDAVLGKTNNFENIVATYQTSLNRVTEAIATSTLALDAQKTPKISGVICSS